MARADNPLVWLRGDIKTPPLTAVSLGTQDSRLTRYELYAFNAKGEQTAEAQRVLRRGHAAKGFMRAFFARPDRAEAVATTTLSAAPTTPVLPSTPMASIGVGSQCLLDTHSLEMTCGSKVCYSMFSMRVPMRAVAPLHAGAATEPAGGTGASVTGGSECPGVGSLWLNGEETLTLYLNDGDGGGGTGNPCGGGGGDDDPGDGTVDPPGGGEPDQTRWGRCAETRYLDRVTAALKQIRYVCCPSLQQTRSVRNRFANYSGTQS